LGSQVPQERAVEHDLGGPGKSKAGSQLQGVAGLDRDLVLAHYSDSFARCWLVVALEACFLIMQTSLYNSSASDMQNDDLLRVLFVMVFGDETIVRYGDCLYWFLKRCLF
jgi:hypothetical protein